GGVVLLFGIEEGVLRGAAEMIAMGVGDYGPVLGPGSHPFLRGGEIGLAPVRFVVIGEDLPGGDRAVEGRSRQSAPDQPGQPELRVARELHCGKNGRWEGESRTPASVRSAGVRVLIPSVAQLGAWTPGALKSPRRVPRYLIRP